MSVIATYNFNIADTSPLPSPWVQAGLAPSAALQVVSNECRSTGGDGDMYYNTTTPNDSYAQITIPNVDSTSYVGPLIRCTAGKAYFAYTNASANLIRLYRVTSGPSFTQIGTAAQTLTAGDTIRIEAVGTTIRYKLNGVTKIEVTGDSTFTSGFGGVLIGVAAATDRVDNFEVGDFSVSADLAWITA